MRIESYKGRELLAGTKVFVYKNLHNRKFSIKNLETGLVVGHAISLALTDVTFKVSEAGRQRVLTEQRKNVHAGIVGTYLPEKLFNLESGTNQVSYNPYYCGVFYDVETKEDVTEASEVYFAVSGRVYYNR